MRTPQILILIDWGPTRKAQERPLGFLDLQKALHKFLSLRECQNLQNQWARGTINIIAVRLVIKYHISPPLVMVGLVVVLPTLTL